MLLSVLVQVTQGKMSSKKNAPVSWLSFRTLVDVRTCGNVEHSSSANISVWSTQWDNLQVLSDATTNCDRSARLLGLADVAFAATLPPLPVLSPGVPNCCTPLTLLMPAELEAADAECCLQWMLDNYNNIVISREGCPCEYNHGSP